MDRKRFWFVIVIGSFCAIRAWSQSDAQFNQYFSVLGYYNPAYAGTAGGLNVSGMYNLQWLGMKNAPKTMVLTADMPWKYGKSEHGLGVVVYSETLGLDKNLYTSAQYAFRKKIGKGMLSIGLQAGLVNMAFDGAGISIPDDEDEMHQPPESDEAMTTAQADAMGLDLAAGLFFSTAKFYIGLASTHLLESKLELDENMDRTIGRGYNLAAGYNIQLKNPLLELQPSVFAQSNLQMVSTDVTLRAVYNKMYSGGIGGRVSDSGKMSAAILYFGMTIKGFRFGYAYEFPVSALIRTSAGSHELMATYRLNIDKPKGNRNRHKSVRIL
ncbi:MAG: type IX secretion system membrane protein PorP/SprF [Tannerella sp.]|jgi:type IX secretion system PorP/SprF family membrane protein|nr:type IX secretion system membrane protein PorP/SprF [Tannerella sp.]